MQSKKLDIFIICANISPVNVPTHMSVLISPERIQIKNARDVRCLFFVQVYNPLNNKRLLFEYIVALTLE